MLKMNSKEVKEKILKWIFSDMDFIKERYQYDIDNGILQPFDIEMSNNLCAYIWHLFEIEKPYALKDALLRGISQQAIFEEWAQGLALGNLFIYYYNVSAVDLLGDILEQTKEERNKYTETQAESKLTYLIYREVIERAPHADISFDNKGV